ncbi:hypothetical protein [Streptomyces sp. WM6386]|uniref:hypothetical protein n=1 Tax=Streptomyces sp. WM6386 TaxID=1415558 RepID=UPI000A43E128|nr:hypothetical protein [Streptomyces sp. WM6386]
MTVLVLVGILALAVFGCVCVVWAERGGPTWVRAVAAVTIGLGKALQSSGKRRGGGSSSGGGDD